MLRGSDILAGEIRAAAVTYQKVIQIVSDVATLDCGHSTDANNKHNPAHVGQMRFCQACTDEKLQKTGDI